MATSISSNLAAAAMVDLLLVTIIPGLPSPFLSMAGHDARLSRWLYARWSSCRVIKRLLFVSLDRRLQSWKFPFVCVCPFMMTTDRQLPVGCGPAPAAFQEKTHHELGCFLIKPAHVRYLGRWDPFVGPMGP